MVLRSYILKRLLNNPETKTKNKSINKVSLKTFDILDGDKCLKLLNTGTKRLRIESGIRAND